MKCFNLFKAFFLTVVLALPGFYLGNTAHAGWSQPVRISEVGDGFYPQIITQGDTLHVVYENLSGYDKICYLRSSDGGATWSQHRVLSQNPGHVYFPHIMRWNQRLLAAWRVYFSSGVYRFNIGYSISENNGLTWSIPQYALNPNWDYINSFSISLNDSIINIVFYSDQGVENAFFEVRSIDFGANWSNPRNLFVVQEAGVSDQVNEGDLIHFIWDGRFNLVQRWEIYYTQSTDGGLNWSPNIPLSDTDQFHSQLPAIACDSSGVACSWMDYKYSPNISTGDILLRTSGDSGLNWSPEIQVTRNHYSRRSDIAEEGDTIYLAWEDYRHENGDYSIYSARSTDGGVSWDEPYWVDADTNGSWNPAIACSNGKAYLVWYDRQLPDSFGLYFSGYEPESDVINEEGNNIPDKISLRAYPNPFNSAVTINYSNLKGSEIGIYDIQGKLIRTLKTDGGDNGKIIWDATDALGNKVSSGEYFLKTNASKNSTSLRLIYLK